MKADVKIETVQLTCPCGYTGVLGYENILRCPRCKDHWSVSIRTNVISINIFDEWVSRTHGKAQDKFNTIIQRSLVEQQLRRIVDVEELMWRESCIDWDLNKWRTCMKATIMWVKREIVDNK